VRGELQGAPQLRHYEVFTTELVECLARYIRCLQRKQCAHRLHAMHATADDNGRAPWIELVD
jgi:hypothetical protein